MSEEVMRAGAAVISLVAMTMAMSVGTFIGMYSFIKSEPFPWPWLVMTTTMTLATAGYAVWWLQ